MLSTNCTFCCFDETHNSVKFVGISIPFQGNITFLKILGRKKKKKVALAEKPKHVETEMIKVKLVITSVTKVLSHMLAVCLTELGSL